MDNVIIDELIESHQNWLEQFRALLADDNTAGVMNIAMIESHKACDFAYRIKAGKIHFSSPLLEDIVRDIHASFHGVAALLMELHNQKASKEEFAEYHSVLEHLSAQLIAMLKKSQGE